MNLYFNVLSPLDRAGLERFLTATFNYTSFRWIRDLNEMYDYSGPEDCTFIEQQIYEEEFKYYYSVWGTGDQPTVRQQVDILTLLSHQENTPILCTDDEPAGFSWVLIQPDGTTSTVQTSTDGELVVEDYYNFRLGDFRTKAQLSAEEEDVLLKIISPFYPTVGIDYATDGPVINGEFDRVKEDITLLRGFDHHYSIQPAGKNTWLDIAEKSALFLTVMKDFQQYLQQEICVFPRNFREIRNIPGGSDSEEHCIVLTDNAASRVVYKTCRESW
ncbi:hypothetical protein [Chitinophaga rhizophila]|uniref:Uncharacterized protein n=1 Tax=Chitinophaga rhizophila TaxID=2866212 RepID=A0ABS7GKT9_9BACT|nr:hypothetical protein [Chitinophaga rhizophila]MBW8688343.1 hypothetical protein [Chitinophaga rhizophila]